MRNQQCIILEIQGTFSHCWLYISIWLVDSQNPIQKMHYGKAVEILTPNWKLYYWNIVNMPNYPQTHTCESSSKDFDVSSLCCFLLALGALSGSLLWVWVGAELSCEYWDVFYNQNKNKPTWIALCLLNCKKAWSEILLALTKCNKL